MTAEKLCDACQRAIDEGVTAQCDTCRGKKALKKVAVIGAGRPRIGLIGIALGVLGDAQRLSMKTRMAEVGYDVVELDAGELERSEKLQEIYLGHQAQMPPIRSHLAHLDTASTGKGERKRNRKHRWE